jgi:hypothetical protein
MAGENMGRKSTATVAITYAVTPKKKERMSRSFSRSAMRSATVLEASRSTSATRGVCRWE